MIEVYCQELPELMLPSSVTLKMEPNPELDYHLETESLLMEIAEPPLEFYP